jgi:NhaP-type Na+/H+ and K+/H+ antiporter
MAQDSDYLALSIDDPFEVLGVSRDCDQRELKRKYQQLARELHPDKNQYLGELERKEKTKMFQNVEKAYHLLENESDRERINAKLTGEDLRQDWPVSDTLILADMEYCPEEKCYSCQCRCGGSYVVQEEDLPADCVVICCSFCTLCIEVCVRT